MARELGIPEHSARYHLATLRRDGQAVSAVSGVYTGTRRHLCWTATGLPVHARTALDAAMGERDTPGVARAAGIDTRRMQRLRRGDCRMYLDEAVAIARVLGCDLSRLA